MRLHPSTSFGTEQYPEKVARRLRAVNITAWSTSGLCALFAIARLLDPVPGRRTIGVINAAVALVFALIPLLHRVGPLAAPIAFVAIAYAFLFWVISFLGTGSGAYLYYLTTAALGTLFLGTERRVLTAALGVISVSFIIAVHLLFPYDTGFMPPAALFFGSFITNVVASSTVLFAVVFYAVRQMAGAEATAEHEY